jgi:hypothetical protein
MGHPVRVGHPGGWPSFISAVPSLRSGQALRTANSVACNTPPFHRPRGEVSHRASGPQDRLSFRRSLRSAQGRLSGPQIRLYATPPRFIGRGARFHTGRKSGCIQQRPVSSARGARTGFHFGGPSLRSGQDLRTANPVVCNTAPFHRPAGPRFHTGLPVRRTGDTVGPPSWVARTQRSAVTWPGQRGPPSRARIVARRHMPGQHGPSLNPGCVPDRGSRRAGRAGTDIRG